MTTTAISTTAPITAPTTTTTTTTAPPWSGLRTVAIDVAVPLGVYLGLHTGLGVGLVASLAASSVVPVLRSLWSLRQDHRLPALAVIMLAANLAGIALSFATGDARFALAKDAGISGVVAAVMVASVVRARPALTAGLQPWVVRGDAARAAAWDRLADTVGFRRLERRFTLVWGAILLTDCVLRVVGAYLLPTSTMAWLSTVVSVTGLVVAAVVGGAVGAEPMTRLVAAEADRAQVGSGNGNAAGLR